MLPTSTLLPNNNSNKKSSKLHYCSSSEKGYAGRPHCNWRKLMHFAMRRNQTNPASKKSRLITFRKNGAPSTRCASFWSFSPHSDELLFFADKRKEKCEQIDYPNQCTLEWFFPLTSESFTIQGSVRFIDKNETDNIWTTIRETAWKELPPSEKEIYLWRHEKPPAPSSQPPRLSVKIPVRSASSLFLDTTSDISTPESLPSTPFIAVSNRPTPVPTPNATPEKSNSGDRFVKAIGIRAAVKTFGKHLHEKARKTKNLDVDPNFLSRVNNIPVVFALLCVVPTTVQYENKKNGKKSSFSQNKGQWIEDGGANEENQESERTED